jgi:putative DNA primase/helicase
MTYDLRTLARLLGGNVAGKHVLCPGPGHSRRDRSLQVTPSAYAQDGFLVHSFSGDPWQDCRDLVRERLGLPPWEPGDGQDRRVPADRVREWDRWALDRETAPRQRSNDDLNRPSRDPLDIWREARDAHGTPVETYLARRGLTLPRRGGEALRYHPSCPFAGAKVPAMIALVRNVATNAPQAIHRTALDADVRKKLSLGPISGGAIKLTPDDEVTSSLGIAEGIETALSLQRLPEWYGSPVWSLIASGGVRKFPLLSGIETLAIATDHDRAWRRRDPRGRRTLA